jgi:hypothetical protein
MAKDTRLQVVTGHGQLAKPTGMTNILWRILHALASITSGKNSDNTDLVLSTLQPGAPNMAVGNVAAGVASGVLVAARPTRRRITIINEDAANFARISTGVPTAAVGLRLPLGVPVVLNTTAAINVIRTGGADVAVSFIEEYD